ncbi:hypothetical protein ACFL3V_03960 [Nanoarchaeota archaeon]
MSLRKRPDHISELVFLALALSIMIAGYAVIQSGITGRIIVSPAGSAPFVSLAAPADMYNSTGTDVSLICDVTSANLSRVEVYTDVSGVWSPDLVEDIGGSSFQAVLNLSGLEDGFYSWNCFAYDISNYSSSAPQNRSFRIDSTPPAYSGSIIDASNPVVYSPDVNYTFSINWSDAGSGMDDVWIVWDNVNHTLNSSGNTYTFTAGPLAAGVYNYSWSAADGFGNTNSTDVRNFTVLKSESSIDLAVDGLVDIFLLEHHSFVNITASLVEGESAFSLYLDGVLLGTASSDLNTLLQVNGTGLHETTAVYPGTENYSVSSASVFFFTVGGNSSAVRLLAPPDTFNTSSPSLELSCDTEGNVSNITLYTNASVSWLPAASAMVNISSAVLGHNMTGLDDGLYAWTCLGFEGASASYTAPQPISFTVDRTPPTWDQPLPNLTINYSDTVIYDVSASDLHGISGYSVNDSRFAIDASGVITTAAALEIGTYSIRLGVNDTLGNLLSDVLFLAVVDMVSPSVDPRSPRDHYSIDEDGVDITCSASDRDLSRIVLYTNMSGNWQQYDSVDVNGSTASVEFSLSGLAGSSFVWACSAFDSSGNSVASENKTLYVEDEYTAPSGSGSGGGGGSTTGPCSTVSCPDTCEKSQMKYDGSCTAIHGKGVCYYSSRICMHGCSDGACLPDSCEDVKCTPRVAQCSDGSTARCTPSCSDGICRSCRPACPSGDSGSDKTAMDSLSSGTELGGEGARPGDAAAQVEARCGDGTCSSGETQNSCPSDCTVESADALLSNAISFFTWIVVLMVIVTASSFYVSVRRNQTEDVLQVGEHSKSDAVELDRLIINKLSMGIPPLEIKKAVVDMGWPSNLVDYYIGNVPLQPKPKKAGKLRSKDGKVSVSGKVVKIKESK